MAPHRAVRPVLLPLAVVAAALLVLVRVPAAFLAPHAPSPSSARQPQQLRPSQIARQSGGGVSTGTGLVWPSPEAQAKLQVDGDITLYPTHNWQPGMKAVLPATRKLDKAPVMIGVAADSGCGKSTFLRRILGALGTEVSQGHTAVGDMMTVLCLDDYHINDRAGRKATGLTALDVKENDFKLMDAQMSALKAGKAINKPIYNHDTGFKDAPELIEPNKVVVIEGLHPIFDEGVRKTLDLGIYIDIVNEVKFDWKVRRDVTERGWTEEQVRADIQKRLPDFSAYVDPQKANADVILRYEPSDKGLPYLKVKLIQKKGGAFPPIALTKSLEFSGPVGASLKMYEDEWFGHKVTVVEMDGEIDMSKMETQLAEIESSMTGLAGKSSTELTDAMAKLKSSPGSLNGTGLFQTVIAMKVREVYERLTK